MGVGKFLHVVYKVGTVGKRTSTFPVSSILLIHCYCIAVAMSPSLHLHTSPGSPRSESPGLVPIVECMTTEELDSVFPLVL